MSKPTASPALATLAADFRRQLLRIAEGQPAEAIQALAEASEAFDAAMARASVAAGRQKSKP